MNRDMVRDIVQLKRDVSQINNEIPDAGITLRRTDILAITTAGTIITWQSRIRGQGITWSGSTITIPASGWYGINLSGQTSVNINDLFITMAINGLNVVQSAGFIGDIDRNRFSASFIRYFTRGNTIVFVLTPSANVNLVANPENVAGESPILHIVQISNEAES